MGRGEERAMEGYETGEESRGEAKEVRHCLLTYIRD